jgi:hypothetical protein
MRKFRRLPNIVDVGINSRGNKPCFKIDALARNELVDSTRTGKEDPRDDPREGKKCKIREIYLKNRTKNKIDAQCQHNRCHYRPPNP